MKTFRIVLIAVTILAAMVNHAHAGEIAPEPAPAKITIIWKRPGLRIEIIEYKPFFITECSAEQMIEANKKCVSDANDLIDACMDEQYPAPRTNYRECFRAYERCASQATYNCMDCRSSLCPALPGYEEDSDAIDLEFCDSQLSPRTNPDQVSYPSQHGGVDAYCRLEG